MNLRQISLRRYSDQGARDAYRAYLDSRTPESLIEALVAALPVAQIAIYSTYRNSDDKDDLVMAAALAYLKAFRGCVIDPDHRGFYTYLYRTAKHAIEREGRRICAGVGVGGQVIDYTGTYERPSRATLPSVVGVEVSLFVSQVLDHAFDLAVSSIRFSGRRGKACRFIIGQIRLGHPVPLSLIRRVFGIENPGFLYGYCESSIKRCLYQSRDVHGMYRRSYKDYEMGFYGEFEIPDLGRSWR